MRITLNAENNPGWQVIGQSSPAIALLLTLTDVLHDSGDLDDTTIDISHRRTLNIGCKRTAISPAMLDFKGIGLPCFNTPFHCSTDSPRTFWHKPLIQRLNRQVTGLRFIAIQHGKHFGRGKNPSLHIQRPVTQFRLPLGRTQYLVIFLRLLLRSAALLKTVVQHFVCLIQTQPQGFKLRHKRRRNIVTDAL